MHLSPVYPLWTGEVTLDSAQENHKDWYAKIPRQLLFVPNGRKTLASLLLQCHPTDKMFTPTTLETKR